MAWKIIMLADLCIFEEIRSCQRCHVRNSGRAAMFESNITDKDEPPDRGHVCK